MMRATADQHEWLMFHTKKVTWSRRGVGVELGCFLRATNAPSFEASVPLSRRLPEHWLQHMKHMKIMMSFDKTKTEFVQFLVLSTYSKDTVVVPSCPFQRPPKKTGDYFQNVPFGAQLLNCVQAKQKALTKFKRSGASLPICRGIFLVHLLCFQPFRVLL
jgi:hypothetical protein